MPWLRPSALRARGGRAWSPVQSEALVDDGPIRNAARRTGRAFKLSRACHRVAILRTFWLPPLGSLSPGGIAAVSVSQGPAGALEVHREDAGHLEARRWWVSGSASWDWTRPGGRHRSRQCPEQPGPSSPLTHVLGLPGFLSHPCLATAASALGLVGLRVGVGRLPGLSRPCPCSATAASGALSVHPGLGPLRLGVGLSGSSDGPSFPVRVQRFQPPEAFSGRLCTTLLTRQFGMNFHCVCGVSAREELLNVGSPDSPPPEGSPFLQWVF
jgi:hypothetical protein